MPCKDNSKKLHSCSLITADDEVERMRHAMAETASLLASAAYQQPQADLQIYKERLADHLANPSQPLNLDIDAQSTAEQKAQQGGQQEGLDQQRGQLRTPPKTPGQDPAGRAARAKRAASSREVSQLQHWSLTVYM